MTAYDYRDYKQFLREYVKVLRKNRPSFTLARLAENLGIQPTYVSRVLNDGHSHFSEDQLFRVLGQFDLSSMECEYIMVLRAFQSTGLPDRKRSISHRLDLLQRTRDYADFRAMRRDLKRMADALKRFDPSV